MQELLTKYKNLLRANEELELKNEGLVKEKCAAQSQQSIIKIVRELEVSFFITDNLHIKYLDSKVKRIWTLDSKV